MIETVINIADQATALVMKYYRKADLNVELKSDASPLTQADLESHAFISAELERHFPHPVVSEEASVEYAQRKTWKTLWLVDPLDGTKDFIAATDEFTINIALIQDQSPVLGVVAVPALGLLYYAARGTGAFKRDQHGNRSKIFNNRDGKDLICAESRFHASPQTIEFCRHHSIKKVLNFGSAMKLCKIAEGEIDVYPRFKPTMEWDTAAGHCILNEGGGKLMDMVTKTEMVYNKESLVNNSFIASLNSLNFT